MKLYRQAIAEGLGRLRVLVDKREQIDGLIGRLRRVVIANAAMLPDAEREETLRSLQELVGTPRGFTDAVREFVRRNPEHWFTAIAVRNGLRTVNFDVGEYDNPLASIHTILKRLLVRGEVDRNASDGSYRWRKG
jgi:hypothetical protein